MSSNGKCRFCHNRNHGITSVKCASLEKGKRIDIAREYVHLMIIILAAVTIQIMIPTAVTIRIMIVTVMAMKIFLSEKKTHSQAIRWLDNQKYHLWQWKTNANCYRCKMKCDKPECSQANENQNSFEKEWDKIKISPCCFYRIHNKDQKLLTGM